MDLVRELRGDRVGLVAFRGRALVLCPLTTDYGFFAQVLEGVDVDSAPMGETNIGDALDKALDAFESDAGAHRAVVLISDGEDLAGKGAEAADRARQRGVTIFTVGLGSASGAEVPSAAPEGGGMIHEGKPVMSRLDHETLRLLAEKTGGAYVPVGLANVKLGALYRDHLARMAARELDESVRRRFVERYQLFLAAAVLCFLAVLFLSRGQPATGRPRPAGNRTVPPDRGSEHSPAGAKTAAATAGTAALVILAAVTGRAQPMTNPAARSPRLPEGGPPSRSAPVPGGRAGARLAQGLCQRGRFAEAADAYREAARTATRSAAARYLFNAGCALYGAGRYEDAARLFRDLTLNPEADRGAPAWNLGNALARQSDGLREAALTNAPAADERVRLLQQAGAAFQQAVRARPDAAHARDNLAWVARHAPDAEQQARVTRLMAEHGTTPPDQLADRMLATQRELITRTLPAFTNPTPARITLLEGLAAEQRRNADLLIPLQARLSDAAAQAGQSVAATNLPAIRRQLAALEQYVSATREQMDKAADRLRDLDPAGLPAAAAAETGVYALWKPLATFPLVLREDLLRQTNAIALTEPNAKAPAPEPRRVIHTHQAEALDLTRLFAARFEQAVPPEGLPAPAGAALGAPASSPPSTNAATPLITAETRRQILDLAVQAAALQEHAATGILHDATLDTALSKERRAHALLTEIEKLLPQQSQPQPQPRDQQQQPQEPPQQPPQQPPPETQPQPEESKPEPEPQPRKEDLSKQEARRILDKARQREREHEEDLRQRDAYVPLAPIGRDW
jgi:tetratricopeptide (TPR) repeat protein